MNQTQATNKGYSAREIANKLSAKIIGDETVILHGIKPLEHASKSDLSFLSASSGHKYVKLRALAAESSAGAMLINRHDDTIKTTQIITPNPLAAVIALAPIFYTPPCFTTGIDQTARMHPSAILGSNVAIGAYSVIGADVCIGDNTIIHPHVVLYPGVKVGTNCIIHSGAILREFTKIGDDCIIQNGVILGGDGFGYIPTPSGHMRIPHIGTVALESSVDIGANTTIDRATLGETIIGTNTKIDNLVMVGHNTQIGKRTLICGHVGISGSCKIGDDVVLGGNVGVADHVEIGNKTRAGAKAGIVSNVTGGVDIAGHPQIEAGEWRRQVLLIKKLPSLFKQVKELKSMVEQLLQ